MPSIKQIAEKAGVSISTVSFVLNGKGNEYRISKETQDKILQVAGELNYVPKERKTYKSSASYAMRIVLLVASRSSSMHYGTLFACLQNALYDAQCPVQLSMQAYIPGKLSQCDTLMGELCDGMIIAGLNEIDYEYLHELQTDIPIVLYNHKSDRFPYVACDNYNSTISVVSMFAAHKKNNVCMVSPFADSTGFNSHLLGFSNGCAINNIENATIFFCEYSKKGGEKIAGRIMQHEPDAIFVSSYQIALSILQELTQRGVSVPQQVELVSIAPFDVSVGGDDMITTLDIPANEMISAALNMLIDIKYRDENIQPKVFPMDITYRQSCPK